MSTIHIALLPRDGFFVKDGRGWGNTTSGSGRSLDWPYPSTLLGALRTAVGQKIEQIEKIRFSSTQWQEKTKEVKLEQILAGRRPQGEAWNIQHRMWPLPLDLVYLENEVKRFELRPLPNTVGRHADAAIDQLCYPIIESHVKSLPGPRWWTEEELSAWILEQPIVSKPNNKERELPRNTLIRLAVNPESFANLDGYLFATEMMETLVKNDKKIFEWAINITASIPDHVKPHKFDHLVIGGEGRLAQVTLIEPAWFNPPQVLTATRNESYGLRLLAVTPAYFDQGWLPNKFKREGDLFCGELPNVKGKVVLRAALTGRPLPLSGWDMEKHAPKPISRLVPAGSVYFFEKADKSRFTAQEMKNLWLVSCGNRSNEGFGRFVPGYWNFPPS